MPSICFVNDFFLKDDDVVISGPMVQMYLIGKELAKRGWQVSHVVTTWNNKIGENEIQNGMDVHYLRHHRYGELIGAVTLLKKLSEVDADVYYQRGRSPMTGIVAYLTKQNGKKFIWSAAGEGGMARGKYTQEQLQKRSCIRKALLYPYFWLQDRLYEYGIQRANIVLAQTEYQLRRLQDVFSRDGIVLHSGHPIPNTNVLQKPDPPVVMWVGSIKSLKQPELFIELANCLREEKASFIMMGRLLDESYRHRIVIQAEIQKNFSYIGEVAFAKTSEWFAKASLVINTSLIEGLPNVFVQSWLHGVPVVSLFSDPDDLIKKHRLGYQTGTFCAIVEKVRELIRDATLRQRMGRNARNLAVREFGIECVVDKFVATVHGDS